jgi:hypothetical protein
MRVRRRHLALGFAAAALLAGCGNDDAPIEPVSTSTTETDAGTLSQEEFITSADARCAEANAALANLDTETTAATSTTSQERSITQGLLTGLQGIGDAEDPDGSLAAYYAALKDQVKVLKQQEQAIASGDTTAADALDTDLDSAKSEAQSAAEQYGFEECGQEGTTLPETGTSTSVAPTATTPAPATTTPVTPTTTPVAPAPVAPAPPATGGTSSGGTSPSGGTGTGGTSSGSGGGSGGFSP